MLENHGRAHELSFGNSSALAQTRTPRHKQRRSRWQKMRWLSFAMLGTVWLAGCGINNIPTYDESVNARWSDVQNQYKRRADLIPNLIETVKGFAQQEADVLQQVTEARTRVTQTSVSPEILSDEALFQQFQQKQNALGGALSKLMLVAENYPDLKSNENFLQLQTQLEGTENRIAVARRDYIQAVERYNTELRTIPGRWWHQFMYSEMRPKATFSTDPGDFETPEINFNSDDQS